MQRGFTAAAANETIKVDVGIPFQGYLIDPPSSTVETTKDELLKFFTEMSRMRRMEIQADVLYKSKFIRGFCHLYDGQEAIAVGMEASLNFDDAIITAYRDHCTHLGRGGTVLEVMAELMGKVDGCSLGKGGSMHMYKRKNNFYGGNGIVGAQQAVGAGIAFGLKYQQKPNVCIAMYGDGAANQGQLFEALNMAALWKLPLIYVCENNQYGMGTPTKRSAADPVYYKRGHYTPGLLVDGMNAMAVKEGIRFAKEHCLSGAGPIILEMDTYRYHGHSMSDPGVTYRRREEIQAIRAKRDPIEFVRKLLLEHDWASVDELKAIEKEVRVEIDKAIDTAKASKDPEEQGLYDHMYVQGKGYEVRGVDVDRTRIKL
eukprot:jgi/Chlat1/6685/Chrsp49S06138